MIPQFPQFKPIELSDREEVEKVTDKYPPYSDFNFVSMWSWDTKGQMRLSLLDGNLVVRFTDYITGQPFYSFLGNTNVNETALKLIELSKKEGLEPVLKLVPEDVVKNMDGALFGIAQDQDHFDYILSAENLQAHTSKKLRYHFNLSKRLLDGSGGKLVVRPVDLMTENQKKEVLALTNTWIQNKVSQSKDTVSMIEIDALQRFFLMDAKDNISLGIFYNEKLVGCSINDPLHGDYSLCHFMKADSIFKGIYSCLFLETAKTMLGMGKKYINIEQDLGLANLRQSKESFEPAMFLKKYKITAASVDNPLV